MMTASRASATRHRGAPLAEDTVEFRWMHAEPAGGRGANEPAAGLGGSWEPSRWRVLGPGLALLAMGALLALTGLPDRERGTATGMGAERRSPGGLAVTHEFVAVVGGQVPVVALRRDSTSMRGRGWARCLTRCLLADAGCGYRTGSARADRQLIVVVSGPTLERHPYVRDYLTPPTPAHGRRTNGGCWTLTVRRSGRGGSTTASRSSLTPSPLAGRGLRWCRSCRS